MKVHNQFTFDNFNGYGLPKCTWKDLIILVKYDNSEIKCKSYSPHDMLKEKVQNKILTLLRDRDTDVTNKIQYKVKLEFKISSVLFLIYTCPIQ
jgi:hypothetical protein